MATARALAAYRSTRVLDMAIEGLTYDQIAAEVGYRSKGSVSKALWRALNARQAESVDAYRELELQRLDALQEALWDKALEGDVQAVHAVRKLIEARVRLLGLDRAISAAAGTPRPLVEQSFWDGLKETHGGNLRAWLEDMNGGRYPGELAG